MARPAKSAAASTGNITKRERECRLKTENLLKGGTDKIAPPEHLTDSQVKIFKFILAALDESKLLGNLDVFILARTAITIDKIQYLDQRANEDRDLLMQAPFRQAQTEASKDFFRCCNELCLSPQSRAKLSISTVEQSEKKKTLMELLHEDEEE